MRSSNSAIAAAVFGVAIWALLAARPVAAEEPDADLYRQGIDLFRADDFQGAVRVLQELRDRYPDSRKTDDALYYIGRACGRMDRWPEAEAAYREVLALPDSNRRAEAAYELGRILYRRKDYAQVVGLLEPLKQEQDLDNEDEDVLLLLAKTRYSLGIVAKNGKRKAEARAELREAAAAYRTVADNAVTGRSRQAALLGLAGTWTRLVDVAADAAEARQARTEALQWIDRALPGAEAKDAAELESLRARVEARVPVSLGGKAEALGGADALASGPGLRASASGAARLDLRGGGSLELGAGFEHDGFSLKTFNYTAAERSLGDERLLQRTDTLSADLVWRAGSRSALRSRLKLSGDYTAAEDPEHSHLDYGLKEYLDRRLGNAWNLGVDLAFGGSTYPNYLVNGRELDSVEASVSPALTWYAAQALRLELDYACTLKQYLNARYDTAVYGVDAAGNRRYSTHSAGLTARARLGETVRPSLGYTFTWNDSANYDVWVEDASGPPGRFVEGYDDYLEHTVDLGLDLRWSPRLRTELSGSVGLRDYLSYPARDAADVFTGELRRDWDIAAGLELGWLLLRREAGGFADLGLLLRGSWKQSISNMRYEEFFDTNYRSVSLFAGVGIER